ncbi:MAG TPA: helix-turn-helix domain-containing protein [Candidatus Limnocylindria bacterium]|jgi:DNA-binding MarR family transcriptional regulator|nr:helix-turn-helix domain-containing protein [Candidatus Limnocylindria bacterium]
MTTDKPVLTDPTLGTLLRHLIEMLDSAVAETYADSGLDYRPRFTPVFRALLTLGPASIQAISRHARITHSAVSQTVSEMAKRGWVQVTKGPDARQHIVALTAQADGATALLRRHWTATNAAAQALDRELSAPLSDLLRETIAVLERRPFRDRIKCAAAELEGKS